MVNCCGGTGNRPFYEFRQSMYKAGKKQLVMLGTLRLSSKIQVQHVIASPLSYPGFKELTTEEVRENSRQATMSFVVFTQPTTNTLYMI